MVKRPLYENLQNTIDVKRKDNYIWPDIYCHAHNTIYNEQHSKHHVKCLQTLHAG